MQASAHSTKSTEGTTSSGRSMPVSDGERRKIIGKLLPFVRAGTSIDYAEFVQHLNPVRSATLIRKIHDTFLSGALWNMWGRRHIPSHEPIRVFRRMQDLRAADPNISLREIARRLAIPWGTFHGINAQVETLPASELVFSRKNTSFRRQYLCHVRLAKLRLRASLFVLTDIEVVGAFIAVAEAGGLVELHLDRQCMLSPFAAPRIKELLAAGVHVFTQKVAGEKPQHQKMIIVDDILVSTGSVNPSKRGLDWSIENITFHFLAPEIDKSIAEFSDEQRDLFEIETQWLVAEVEAASLKQQVAAARVSAGLCADEEDELAAFEAGLVPDAAEVAAMKAFLAAEGEDTLTEERREAFKAEYRATKAAGKCPKCRTRVPDGCTTTVCAACLNRLTVVYNDLKRQRMCPACKQPNDLMDMHVYCAACRLKGAELQRQRQAGLDMCGQCKARPRAKNPKKAQSGGLYSTCEVCRARQQRYHRATSERHKVKSKMHYEANKEVIKAKTRAAYRDDPAVRAHCAALNKRYREANIEKVRDRNKRYYREHAETIKAADRAKRAKKSAQRAQADLRRMGMSEAELLAGEYTVGL